MTDNQKKIISQVLFQLDSSTAVQEETVLKMVEMFDGINHQLGAALLTDREKKEIVAELHARLSVRMDRGVRKRQRPHALVQCSQSGTAFQLLGSLSAIPPQRTGMEFRRYQRTGQGDR